MSPGQDITGAVKALKTWPDEKPFGPAHAQDHVVVFDFFAHWCIPCRQASKDVVALEQKSHARSARPRVSFVAVNVEKLQPALTKRFMEQAGSSYPSFQPQDLQDANWIGNRLAELLPLDINEKQALLQMSNPLERLQILIEVLPRFQQPDDV